MMRNREAIPLQDGATVRHGGVDVDREDEYLPDDDLAEDAVLSGATVASFALDDDYGDEVEPIADELDWMGFRSSRVDFG